ncbi:MAG: hypothetical protein P9M15_04630, partial [Candidatus Electryoneaceae bacterium]|nr:hypothetical protein [Candidatus Electryoneaceae bacterium]
IWADFMTRATAGEPTRDFHYSLGLERVYVEPTTGIISNDPQLNYIPIMLKTADLTELLENQMEHQPKDQIEQQIIPPIEADVE